MGNGVSSAPVAVGGHSVRVKKLLGEGESPRLLELELPAFGVRGERLRAPQVVCGPWTVHAQVCCASRIPSERARGWGVEPGGRLLPLIAAREFERSRVHVSAGGFASVYLCEDTESGTQLVLKRMQVPADHEDNLVVAR